MSIFFFWSQPAKYRVPLPQLPPGKDDGSHLSCHQDMDHITPTYTSIDPIYELLPGQVDHKQADISSAPGGRSPNIFSTMKTSSKIGTDDAGLVVAESHQQEGTHKHRFPIVVQSPSPGSLVRGRVEELGKRDHEYMHLFPETKYKLQEYEIINDTSSQLHEMSTHENSGSELSYSEAYDRKMMTFVNSEENALQESDNLSPDTNHGTGNHLPLSPSAPTYDSCICLEGSSGAQGTIYTEDTGIPDESALEIEHTYLDSDDMLQMQPAKMDVDECGYMVPDVAEQPSQEKSKITFISSKRNIVYKGESSCAETNTEMPTSAMNDHLQTNCNKSTAEDVCRYEEIKDSIETSPRSATSVVEEDNINLDDFGYLVLTENPDHR